MNLIHSKLSLVDSSLLLSEYTIMKTITSIMALAFLALASAAPKSTNRCGDEVDGTILPSVECQFYVICQGGSEHQVRCQPMGTFFDVRRMECDRRPNVLCWDGRPTITTTTTTTSAPSEETTTSEEITTSAPSEETTTSAETPTTENQEEETTETESEAPPTTPAPPNFNDMCRGIVVDLLAHPTDCTQFVVCVLGRYSLEQCGANQIFYPAIRVCGYGNPEQC